jgi:hypothetical protein
MIDNDSIGSTCDSVPNLSFALVRKPVPNRHNSSGEFPPGRVASATQIASPTEEPWPYLYLRDALPLSIH